MPQLPALLEGTVEDNIRFAAELGGRDPDVARLLDLAGLDESFAGRDARGSRSASSSARCSLARWRWSRRALLLDEPTSALDASTTGAVEETLLELRERLEISLVLVTHDLEQARRMSEWLVRIESGRAVGQGPTAELLGGAVS